MRIALLIALFAAVLALPAPAAAGGPGMLVGVTDDLIEQNTLTGTRAKLMIAKLAGFDSVRVTTVWQPGDERPTARDMRRLTNLARASRLTGMRVFISVRHWGSRTTPLSEEDRENFAQFAATIARSFRPFRDFVIGNEPNLNRFWMPQYNPDGSTASAPAYLELLAETYDALKAVSRGVRVIGGTLGPRGIDRPGTGRDTHSPTRFIRELGAAYLESERTRPIMDMFAMHPYGDTSRTPPTRRHPNTTAIGLNDYSKLVRLLGQAFDGTAQPGSRLPVIYTEYGNETFIPARKARFYTGTQARTIRPVDERTQAAYYRQAIQLAFCQPTTAGIMIFHVWDEKDMGGWQSGVYYVDETPKLSLAAVRQAKAETRRGVVARCPGLALNPRVRVLSWPSGRLSVRKPLRVRLSCSLDCAYTARLERRAGGRPLAQATGVVLGNQPGDVVIQLRGVKKGVYRLRLSVVAAVNRGTTQAFTSPPLRLR